jgi:hypothetical protein
MMARRCPGGEGRFKKGGSVVLQEKEGWVVFLKGCKGEKGRGESRLGI